MSALQLNLGPAKEPLGFIKILQWIFSIFAFATCGGYSGKTAIFLTCPANKNVTLEADFAYPFRLHKATFEHLDTSKCNTTWNTVHLVGDFSSSAQFFVTFAVLVFLYCMGALVLYLGYLHLYRGAGKLPMIVAIILSFFPSVFATGITGTQDFVITVVISFLWLVSTSAWAKALTDIKTSTGENLVSEIEVCKTNPQLCHFKEIRSLGSLNVSVVIGFLNLILWAGNAWFVYKETSFHSPPAASPPNPTSVSSPSGM